MAKKLTQPAAPTGPTFEDGMIVGLLMARGSFSGDKHAGRIGILSTDHVMLQWIRSRIGGTISGPYSDKKLQRYMYQLSGAALQPVIELLSAHMPSGTQRTKYMAWVAKYWPIDKPAVGKPAQRLPRLTFVKTS